MNELSGQFRTGCIVVILAFFAAGCDNRPSASPPPDHHDAATDADAKQTIPKHLRREAHAQSAGGAEIKEAACLADGVCDPEPETDAAGERDHAKDDTL